MKKYLIVLLFMLSIILIHAQTFEIRIIENDYGYLEVQMRETSGTGSPTTSTIVNDISFEIRWNTSLSTDIEVICSSNSYNIEDALGSIQTSGSYNYRVFQAATTPLNPPENWTQNSWMTLTIFKATSGSGTGTFEIAPDGWVAQGLNWNQGEPPIDYTPTVNGSASSYNYPTIVYDLVWKGGGQAGFETDWFFSLNWENTCGVAASSAPNSTLNVYIPDVSTGSGYNLSSNLSGTMSCKNLRIGSGGVFYVPATNGSLAISEKLHCEGTLIITPDANATVSGDTYLDATECLVIQSDATGTGSFIDNGTITYGTSGSAKVQTYLVNNASAPDFHFHLLGPTVNNTGSGVQLSSFNVANGNTYAYKYDEPADDWVNFSALTDPVQTAKGIGLSTNDGNSYTMEMTGELITGNVNSESMTTTSYGNFLLSNPYPSSIFWDDLYSNNIGTVSDEVFVYDASYSGGNYKTYNTSSGGTDDFNGYIQVGQGFFVDALSSGTFAFDNGDRYHSEEPFYKTTTYYNRLDVRASGNGFTDGILVHFYDGASTGYKNNEDVAKKMSYNVNATQLWSVDDDNVNLSINALPQNLLENNYSIPLSFICSSNNDYSLHFLGTETFEIGTELWLEDKLEGGSWISINNNSEYTFQASQNDPAERFVIHFFGPTDINEGQNQSVIEIYSHQQYAYVINNTDEIIKKVCIYTLSGKSVFESNNVFLTTSKYFVSDQLGYYLIQVVTDKKVYVEKLFITK